jgi:hypothetical protein
MFGMISEKVLRKDNSSLNMSLLDSNSSKKGNLIVGDIEMQSPNIITNKTESEYNLFNRQ